MQSTGPEVLKDVPERFCIPIDEVVSNGIFKKLVWLKKKGVIR
jgi:hypothetical protein